MCQSVVPQAVQVEGTVNGEPHFLTADSGAAKIFVSMDVMAAHDLLWDSSIGVDIPNPEPAMSDEKDQDDSHEEEGGLAGIVDSTDRVTQDEVRGGVTRTPQPQWYKRVPNSF